MNIEPRDIVSRVPSCPRRRTDHYAIEMARGVPLKIKAVRCTKCGADILQAYHDARPALFGLTIGDIDRFLILTGGALIAILVASMVFR